MFKPILFTAQEQNVDYFILWSNRMSFYLNVPVNLTLIHFLISSLIIEADYLSFKPKLEMRTFSVVKTSSFSQTLSQVSMLLYNMVKSTCELCESMFYRLKGKAKLISRA